MSKSEEGLQVGGSDFVHLSDLGLAAFFFFFVPSWGSAFPLVVFVVRRLNLQPSTCNGQPGCPTAFRFFRAFRSADCAEARRRREWEGEEGAGGSRLPVVDACHNSCTYSYTQISGGSNYERRERYEKLLVGVGWSGNAEPIFLPRRWWPRPNGRGYESGNMYAYTQITSGSKQAVGRRRVNSCFGFLSCLGISSFGFSERV
jgi:hypothetical protein